jgi:hypothetical protein
MRFEEFKIRLQSAEIAGVVKNEVKQKLEKDRTFAEDLVNEVDPWKV